MSSAVKIKLMSPEPTWRAPIPTKDLAPQSDAERSLWEEIERECELPIQATLKRINRITQDRFPNSQTQTCSSCTGHVKVDGSMLYEQRPKELAHQKIERDAHIYLLSLEKNVSTTEKIEIENFLETLFNSAIKRVNGSAEEKAMALRNTTQKEAEDAYPDNSSTAQATYLFKFHFKVLKPADAFRILEQFWKALEEELNSRDSLDIHTELKIEDFLKDIPLRKGYVSP
ncbi:hypothetical protein HZA86_02015 [Candidatus Uhrbacteria bacterium]|nr:hypothetical protein [Candidatus Uhrbacteria bacterium]